MFKKNIAFPFAKFTEFLLHISNVCMHVCTRTEYGVGACARMDGRGYIFHLCFLHFIIIFYYFLKVFINDLNV